MELIKRYIYAIEKRLHVSGKEDIAKEINSIIMDELEDKYGEKDEYFKEEIDTVLQEMGHPREVAARYRGDKEYLIGPELFPFYKMVIAIVLGATTLGLVISFIVGQFASDANGAKDFLAFIPSLFSALLGGVGGITVSFAIIERFAKFDKKSFDINEKWTAKELPEIPQETDRVKAWEPIAAITFVLIWALFINVYVQSEKILFINYLPTHVSILPILNHGAISRILPLWNISIVATLAVQLILLKQGKWQIGTRIAELILSIFSIVILGVILAAPMFISVEGLDMVFKETAFDVLNVEKYYYLVVKILMILTSIGVVVNTIKLIINQARKSNV